MPLRPLRVVAAALIAALMACPSRAAEPQRDDAGGMKTRNILLVTTDGLRWQEVFGGADRALLNKENGGVVDVAALRREFDRETPEDRRRALLPFLWDVIARDGQLLGDARAGDDVKVTNGKNFSYPGYNEILTGSADPWIDSNDKFPNPNITVLEWLNGRDEFRGRVAAFGSWDVFPYILNRGRSRMRVAAAWEPPTGRDLLAEERMIAELMAEIPHLWDETCYDAFTFRAALGYLKRERPRVLYLGLSETDTWAHSGRYDNYLKAAHRVDGYLKALWETVQSLPAGRGTTTLIVTTDHGRGDAPVKWKDHGQTVPGSDRIWIGVLGPDTPARRHPGRAPQVRATQSQIAATLAAFLGLDYRAAAPRAAPPIAEVLPVATSQARRR